MLDLNKLRNRFCMEILSFPAINSKSLTLFSISAPYKPAKFLRNSQETQGHRSSKTRNHDTRTTPSNKAIVGSKFSNPCSSLVTYLCISNENLKRQRTSKVRVLVPNHPSHPRRVTFLYTNCTVPMFKTCSRFGRYL